MLSHFFYRPILSIYQFVYLSGIFLPPSWSMKRSDQPISTEDELFNYVVYSAGQGRQAPYSVVAAAVVLAGLHFMCW